MKQMRMGHGQITRRLYRYYNSGDLESLRAELEFEKTIATKEEHSMLQAETTPKSRLIRIN